MSLKKLNTLIICLLISEICLSQDLSELKKQKKEIQERIEITNNVLRQNSKNKTSTLSKIRGIGQNINNKKKLIKLLDAELVSLDSKMEKIKMNSQTLSSECDKLNDDYAKMVVNSYYAQKRLSPLVFIFQSENFTELVKKIRFMQEIMKLKKRQISKINEIRQQLSIQAETLNHTRNEKKKMLQTREKETANLKIDERKQRSMLDEIMKKEKNLKSELEKQQKLENDLNAQITKLIQKSQGVETLTAEQKIVEGDFIKNKGRLPWPVEKGFVSRGYGKHADPIYKNVIVNNIGVYIQTVTNARVRAVFKGEVTGCYRVTNTYTVIIKHGNHYTVYSGLKNVSITKGQQVDIKQNIGEIYTNDDNVSELYFLVYEGKTNLNPSLWITQ